MKMKEIFVSLKDPNKKIYLYTVILIGVIIFMLLVFFIIKIIIGPKMTYVQIEKVMVQSTKKYAESSNMLLKNDNFNKTIKMSTLIEKKYMKEFKKYNRKAELCTGKVMITYNGDKFLYTPELDCGKDYKTKYLQDEIKKSKLTDDKEGLYPVNDYYVYKGEYPNNYIKFADEMWRIIKVEADGTIKIIQTNNEFENIYFDNRYNATCPEDEYDCAGFNNFDTSRLKRRMMKIFNEGVKDYNYSFKLSDFDKTIINHQNICMGGVSSKIQITDGYPECDLKSEKKYPFDFVKVNEYIMPSLDSNCKSIQNLQCTNYNYMTKSTGYWTTATSTKYSYRVFYISDLPKLVSVSDEMGIKFVMNLSKNTLYESGDGTFDNPYVIKDVIS